MEEKAAKPVSKFRAAVEQAEQLSKAKPVKGEGTIQFQYPDYETYRQVQINGNKAKLNTQFVNKEHCFFLANWLNENYGPVDFGLCHGVRRGKEQGWMRRRLPRTAMVIGTEISDTATQFPNTVQWDFHDENPEWTGKADFIYSNSWDHAMDPHKAFRAWHATLKPGGVLLLDHTPGQMPKAANALDPFGATWTGLEKTILEALGDKAESLAPLDRRDDPKYPARVMVVRKK